MNRLGLAIATAPLALSACGERDVSFNSPEGVADTAAAVSEQIGEIAGEGLELKVLRPYEKTTCYGRETSNAGYMVAQYCDDEEWIIFSPEGFLAYIAGAEDFLDEERMRDQVSLLVGHEYGHRLQFTRLGIDLATYLDARVQSELGANCIGGYMMSLIDPTISNESHYQGPISREHFLVANSGDEYEFTHGSDQEQRNAISDGFRADCSQYGIDLDELAADS